MKKIRVAAALILALIMSFTPLPGTGTAEKVHAYAGIPNISSIEEPAAISVKNAIIYQIRDGKLEYNMSHTADIANDAEVTGHGISSLAGLIAVLGTADKPVPSVSTEPGDRTLGEAVTADINFDEYGVVIDIRITGITHRPVIGISWKQSEIKNDYQSFAEAFERGGAYAVFLPQITTEEDACSVLEQVDGVFVTGGYGWNPKYYNASQTPHGSTGWNEARDISDLMLIRQAIEKDIPLLCVCRATQGLNIALGGGIIQDIPLYLGQKVLNGEIDQERVTRVLSGSLPGSDESVKDTGYYYYDENGEVGPTYDADTDTYQYDMDCKTGHLRVQVDGIDHSSKTGYHPLSREHEGIGISKDSKWLYDIIGQDEMDLVASAHHQACDPEHLGEGLSIAAMSSDGVVEAIEYTANTFALGLQWHPERDALGDSRDVDIDQDTCDAPLRALIKYALQRRCERELPQSAKIDISVCTVDPIKSRTYTGSAIRPEVSVWNGSTKLRLNTDYTVSYSRNRKVGRAALTITGIGSYGGSVSKRFKIIPKGTKIYRLKKSSKGFTVKWKKQSVQTTGYQIQYSTSKGFRAAGRIVTVTGAKRTSRKISGLRSKRTYYVRIRTYKKAGNATYYSRWSKAKKL